MKIQDLQSQINAVTARMEQVNHSTHYSDPEKAKLKERYAAELQQLEAQYAEALAGVDVNDPQTLSEGK